MTYTTLTPKRLLVSALLLCATLPVLAQDVTPTAPTDNSTPASTTELPRYDITTAFISTRMRAADDTPAKGQKSDRMEMEQQHKEKLEGWLRLDKSGIFTLYTSISSGYYFTRSYAETGWGTPWYSERGWNLFMRQLYMQVEPVKGVQFQYGSLGIERGAVSENISYDEDGYIDGGRLLIKRPKNFFFDEMAVTYAYLGDYTKPNMFNRLGRFQQSNYHQFLVAKKIGNRLTASADLTHHGWSETVRLGAILDVHESKVFSAAKAGWYDRYNTTQGHGYELAADRNLFRNRVKLTAGYVSVDLLYKNLETPYDHIDIRAASATGAAPGGPVQADRFGLGNQPYGSVTWKMNSVLRASFFARGVVYNDNKKVNTLSAQILSLDFDLLPLAQKMGIHTKGSSF